MEIFFSKNICCEKCPLQFGNRIVLNMHMASVHKIEAETINTEKFLTLKNENGNQQSHIKSSNIISKKIISAYENRRPSNNKTHMEFVHENKKPYKCMICDSKISKKGTRNHHVKSVHEKQKNT